MTASYSAPRTFTESVWLTGQLIELQCKSSGRIKSICLRSENQTFRIKTSKYFRVAPGYDPLSQDWIQLKVLKTNKLNTYKLKAFELSPAPLEAIPHQVSRETTSFKCISICQSGACRKRGSEKLLQAIAAQFSDAPDLHVESSSCLGKCKIGPAANVNGQICAPVTTDHLKRMLKDSDQN